MPGRLLSYNLTLEGMPGGNPLTAQRDPIKERTRNAISSQNKSNVNVLSSLLAAQDDLGYLPPEAIEEVADFMGTTTNEVWGVASFYTNFRFSPPGNHDIEVCWGPTCHVMGAGHILQRVLDELGLTDEGDTADGEVTLKYNTCLGACSQAPVMSVDHDLIGRISPESARQRLAQIKRDRR